MMALKVLQSFALVGLLATASSSPASFTTVSAAVQSSDSPGCTGSSLQDSTPYQRVELHSGDDLYEMFVPFDGQTYYTGGPSPALYCVSVAVKDAPCVHCHFKMDHVQVMRSGLCTLVLTDDNGQIHVYDVYNTAGLAFFGTPGYLTVITCRESAVEKSDLTSRKKRQVLSQRRPLVSPSSIISSGHSNRQVPDSACLAFSDPAILTLKDTNWSNWQLIVSTDGRNLPLDSSGPVIGCMHGDDNQCLYCDFDVREIVISADVSCTITFSSNGSPPTAVNFAPGVSTLTNPIQLHDISCQHIITATPLPAAHRSREVFRNSAEIEVSGRKTRMIEVRSNACPLAELKITLQGTSGLTDLHVPADGEAYFLGGWITQPYLGCLNAFDKQECSPCDGEYTIVSQDPGLGLCRFDTTDSRVYFFGSGTPLPIDVPPFTPSRVICGMLPDQLHILTNISASHYDVTNASVTLSTEDGRTAIYPPADQKWYAVANESCRTCNSALKSAQVDPKLGLCQFELINMSDVSNNDVEFVNITSNSGNVTFGPQRYLIGVQCGLTGNLNATTTNTAFSKVEHLRQTLASHMASHPAGTNELVAGECNMTNAPIVLTTNDGQVALYPPTDQQIYNVHSESIYSYTPGWSNHSLIGCHAMNETDTSCSTCDPYPFSAQVAPGLGVCQFYLMNRSWGSFTMEYINASAYSGNIVFASLRQFIGIQCGLTSNLGPTKSNSTMNKVDKLKEILASHLAGHHSQLSSNTTSSQQASIHKRSLDTPIPSPGRPTPTLHPRILPLPTSIPSVPTPAPTCPTTIPWRTALTAADGNTYAAPIPNNSSYTALSSQSCLRLSDLSCLACTDIGTVTGVSIHTEWGPCIFSLDDGRAIAAPWVEEGGVPGVVGVEPPGVVGGVTCGAFAMFCDDEQGVCAR